VSKFFVQMVLSVLVAVSAAIGFSPNLKGEVHKTLGEAKSLTHEMTQAIFQTASNVKSEANVSTKASVESEVNAEADGDLHLRSERTSRKPLETEIESSLSAESETEAEAEIAPHNVNLNVEHEIESDLDLNLDLGK
jgi:uncharacterized membrane protein